MNDGVIILLLFAAAIFYFAVILPKQEEKKKAAKEAAEIAMQFADRRPSIFQFDGADGDGRKMVVYALFPCDDGSEIFSCDNYRVLMRIYAKKTGQSVPDAEYKRAIKYIDEVRSNLPYHLPRYFCIFSWNYFEQHKRK